MSEFDDIRPYNDDEVEPCLQRLLGNEEFLDAIARMRFPKLGRLSFVLRGQVRKRLAKEFSAVNSVKGFQDIIESYFSPIIDRTVDKLTFSGLENLPRDKASLFISNHRDIAMDPAFVNWVLYHNGFSTLRIAIGDNLLSKPFASDLMRLNKSFIVNRSATAPREKLKAAKHLSRYIHHSVLQDNENVWIAQREGRAKDGLDASNPAIVSMIALNRNKKMDFSAYIHEANIVPVSISYEYDPCDQLKAYELYSRKNDGTYEKAEHEDVKSIAMGITGYKGNIHLSFGEALKGEYMNTEDVARDLDNKIRGNYVLHPSNCFAYELLEHKSPVVEVGEERKAFCDFDWNEQREKFKETISNCNQKYLPTLLQSYANPVKVRLNQVDA